MDISTSACRGAILVLAACAIFASLDIAQNVFAPLLTAVVVGIVFSPLANTAERFGLPPVAVAVLVLVTGVLVIALSALLLEGPVRGLVEQAPKIWSRMRWELQELRAALSGLEEVSREISDAMDTGDGQQVVQTETSPVFGALSFAPTVLGQIMIFIGALFFFVLTRREIHAAIAGAGTTPDSRRDIAQRLLAMELYVSRYFAAISLINLCLGAATYIVLSLLGMPSPVLWGVLAALLNFMPYLGPAVVTASLLVSGVVMFDGLYSIVPAMCFFLLNTLEGQFITPAVLGRHMQINSLFVFVSLVFWLWLWGPIGGFVAIPVSLCAVALLESRSGRTGRAQPGSEASSWGAVCSGNVTRSM